MKLRNSFVSNSSSSSFICNTDLSVDQIKGYIQRLLDVHNEIQEYQYKIDGFMEIYATDKKGKVVIEELGDGSIPYMIKEFIRSDLNASEMHDG